MIDLEIGIEGHVFDLDLVVDGQRFVGHVERFVCWRRDFGGDGSRLFCGGSGQVTAGFLSIINKYSSVYSVLSVYMSCYLHSLLVYIETILLFINHIFISC